MGWVGTTDIRCVTDAWVTRTQDQPKAAWAVDRPPPFAPSENHTTWPVMAGSGKTARGCGDALVFSLVDAVNGMHVCV